jgi:nucleotide-binding universal stress UspA family protein
MNTPTVLAALDGSEHALVALPVAKALAGVEGVALRIVHVAERELPPPELLARVGIDPGGLRGLVLDARAGEPSQAILRVAAEAGARVLVLCTHTATADPGKTLGSVALHVLRGASMPVVLVRPTRGLVPWSLRRVVLPHDGTPTTSAAARPAAALARRAQAELSVLHVAAPGAAPPPERGALTTPRYLDQPQHEWPAWTGEFIERLACVCPVEELRVRVALAHGAPAAEIVRFAREQAADLVVLAWRGEWEPAHATIVKAVVRDAPCPTMVVRAGAPRDEQEGVRHHGESSVYP